MDPYKLKYNSDYEYYLNIHNKLKDIKLNDTQEKSLYYFACYPDTSTYDMSFEKKINEFGTDYKKSNSTSYTKNKIIARQLCKLQLIDYKIIEEKNPHNRKSYYLTELGIYYIMKHPIFKIHIQSMIKKFPNLKIFEGLLYPFIKKDTICSSNFPWRILIEISSYVQKQYLKIEKFILYAENKKDWEEKRLINIVDEFKLQNYLIERYKDKYQWLETAKIEPNEDDDTIIKFVNIDQPSEYLEVRLRKDGLVILLINGTKKGKKSKKIQNNIPNIFQTQFEKFYSREECIDRSFSARYPPRCSEFISSILPALQTYDSETGRLFLKDKKFIQSLYNTKREVEYIYKSITNPSKYSTEAQAAQAVQEASWVIEFIQEQAQKLMDKTVG